MENRNNILLTVAGIAAFSALAYIIINRTSKTNTGMNTNPNLPRGYRNNNPLNIRISSSNWQGKITPNTDGAFEQFTSMAYGFRAAMVLIRTYIQTYGLNTVAKIISRWAPDIENNTENNIRRVCNTTGFSPDRIIDPYNREDMCDLVYAMAIVENGSAPSWQDIYQAWNLYM